MAFEMLSLSPSLVKDSVLALSAITQEQGFVTLLYAGALIGFVGMILMYSTGKKLNGTLTTFVIAYLVFIMGVQAKVDMVVSNPVTAEAYAISDVPAGLAILGWGTSAVGKALLDLYSNQMTPVGMGEILSRNGVGRGLAIVTGMQGVPWTNRSRTVGNSGANTTNIEASIQDYLNGCYNAMVASENGNMSRWSIFHERGKTTSITAIWDRVKAPIVKTTRTYINGPKEGTSEYCWDAWNTINVVVTSPEFSSALSEDAIDHYAKQLAAMSMPGASVSLASGNSTDLVRVQLKAEADALLNAMFGGQVGAREKILFLDRLNGMMLTAFGASPRNQATTAVGSLGSAWDDAKRQSDLSMAAEGDWWTRNAKPMTQYLELIVLGFLPILLFLMFATPNGMKAVSGIVFVYFWIQTWPIAYVILNHAALGSMMSTFNQFITSTDSMGMEDLYGLWDQARHSYAVSQSLLGMTPILTGAMLSGSMMMLTRLAGGMGSSENLDEKRVYADTESAAPIYQGQSQTSQMKNSDGSLFQNKDMTGTGTDIVVGDTLNDQAQLAKSASNRATTTYNQSWDQTVGKAIQEGDMQALNKVLANTTNFTEGFDSQAITSDSKMQSAAQSYSEKDTASLAGKLRGSVAAKTSGDSNFLAGLASNDADSKKTLGKILGGDVSAGIEAGLSREVSSALVNEYRESQEFRTALSTHLKASDSFNDQDTYTDMVNVSETLTEQDTAKLSEARSDMQTKEKVWTESKSRASNLSSSRIIDEGRQHKIQDEMIREMERNTSNLTGEEQKKAMMDEAQRMGYTKQQAANLTNGIQNELWTAYVPSNAKGTGFEKGAGIATMMRQTMDTQEYNALMVNNDSRIHDPQAKSVNELKEPKNTTNTSNVVEGGAESAVEEAELNKGLVAPDGEFSKPIQEEVDRLSGDVDEKTEYFQKLNTFQEAMALKANSVSAKGDSEANIVDRFVGGPSILTLNTDDHLTGQNAATPYGVSAHRTQSLKEDMENQAVSRTLMLFEGAATAAYYAEEFGQDTEEQQWQSDQIMSNMLREIDKESFDRIKEDGYGESRAEAQDFLRAKLDAVGVTTDLDTIKAFTKDIDTGDNWSAKGLQPTSEVSTYNRLDPMERLGNLVLGIDNDEVEERREDLKKQTAAMAQPGGYGSYSFADDKSNSLYQNVYENLSGKREDGEYVADVYAAELMAMAPFAALNDQGEELDRVLDIVRESGGAFNDGSFMAMFSGGNGPAGFSIERDEIQKIFDQEMGEGSYQKYREEELPNSVKEEAQSKIDEIINKKVDEINKSLSPESPKSVALDNAVSMAISEISKDEGEVEILQNMAKEDPSAVLSAASRVGLYTEDERNEIGTKGFIDKVRGDGAFEQAQNQTIESELQTMMEQNELDEQQIIDMINEKYGENEYAEFQTWKSNQ